MQAQEGIENFKLGKLKPSPDGLADCKTTIRDANMGIGLYSPYKHEQRDYEGYDISRFRNHIRFMEILENRNGQSGFICPLFFDGAVSYFEELPLPEDSRMEHWHNYVNYLTNTRTVESDISEMERKKGISLFTYVRRQKKRSKSFLNILFNKIKRFFIWQ